MVKIQAAERGMTGMREAVVMARLGPDQYFRPHPYAPELQGGLPFHAADHVQWDADFPDHPLTRVRRTLDALAAAVTVEPGFAALPPFTGTGRTPHLIRRPARTAAHPVGPAHTAAPPLPGTGSGGAGWSDGQTSQPTKWTTPASRLVRKFIWSISLCVVHLWDCAEAVCSPLTALCNHHVTDG
ncbi:hypothetical protein SCALM49S_04200 [Streptomyces californicus]